MAENLQRQPAIANLLDLDPLAVAPPVPQPRALADALQPRAFELLPAAPQPSLPRHQPALQQMLILPTSVISELPYIVSLLTKEMLSNRSQKSGMFELATEFINMRTMHEEDQIKKVLEALQPTIQALRSKVFSENPDLHMNAIKLIGALLSNTYIRHDVLRRTDMASDFMNSLIWATQQKSPQ
ncbi:hypothetical protein B566_EDAN016290, partial [Ephemera danica]